MDGGVPNLITPNPMPPMKYEEVKARAQRLLDEYGRPPYTRENFPHIYDFEGSYGNHGQLSEDALALISDFVWHWLPFLVEKGKK